MDEFILNERLANDTIEIMDLELSLLLLMNDKNFPWFILVPKRKDISEIFQLNQEDSNLLFNEIKSCSKQLKLIFNADKINIASYGNQVSQLHIHIILRNINDMAWPNPIWGNYKKMKYQDEEIKKIKDALLKLHI